MPHPVRVFGRSSEIHRFAFMFGLSGEITARGICVEGDVGSLPLVSKFKQRCITVMPAVCQCFQHLEEPVFYVCNLSAYIKLS